MGNHSKNPILMTIEKDGSAHINLNGLWDLAYFNIQDDDKTEITLVPRTVPAAESVGKHRA